MHLRKTRSHGSEDVFISISRELERSTSAKVGSSKVPHVSTFLARAGSRGLEILDTLGSGITNLNNHRGFQSNAASRWNKVSVLAFEVANTIVMGSNLMQSLSQENIQIIEKEMLHSERVQLLVSRDTKELLSIAAADKREEFEVFWRDVVRFGDMCKDPQWHKLDRFLVRHDIGTSRKEAEIIMQEMVNLARHTSELYHECESLDKLEQFCWRKLEQVESSYHSRKGESLMILQNEIRQQRKLVKNLKKKSLWSKRLDEVVEKLVEVVIFIRKAIPQAFKENGVPPPFQKKGLGVAGLALHYANLITQINCIASRPTSLTPNMRDKLYNGLPATVKSDLRSSLRALDSPEVMTVPQIKTEMDKTLSWLVPLAINTTKAHHGFGFVGEWANTGNEFGTNGSNDIIRLQTLYHADKQTMDLYILELVIWLNRLISLTGYHKDDVFPTSKGLNLHSHGKLERIQISSEDENLLEKVAKHRMLVPGISISQEQVLVKKKKKRGEAFASGRSMGKI